MTIEEGFELYGYDVSFPKSKADTNAIRNTFLKMAEKWSQSIRSDFNKRFSNFDDLYRKGGGLAKEVRTHAIDEAMRCLSAYGIYELSESQFYENFMGPYESWTEDFSFISNQHKSLAERTAELDAHRTARRQNRSQWIGYGSEKSVYEADGKNLVSNVQHGIFNLIAKGITEIEHASQKDEVFKNSATVIRIAEGGRNIVMAAFYGVVEAINSEKPEALYDFSEQEVSKSNAILENVRKNRIPDAEVLPALIKAIQFFPYNPEIYLVMLGRFGDGDGCLGRLSNYLGISEVDLEKKRLFSKKLKECDFATPETRAIGIQHIEEYAKIISYDASKTDTEDFLQALANRNLPKPIESRQNLEVHVAAEQGATQALEPIDPKIATKGFASDSESNFFVAPNVPAKKIRNFAKKISNYIVNESDVLFLYDDTIFGIGDCGALIDRSCINIREKFKDSHRYPFSEIRASEISGIVNKSITLILKSGGRVEFELTQSNKGAKMLHEAIQRMIELSKR